MRTTAPTELHPLRYRLAGDRRLRPADERAADLVALVAVRGLRFAAGAFRGADRLSGSALSVGVVAACPLDRRLSWRISKTVPPAPSRIGHSTRPVAPI